MPSLARSPPCNSPAPSARYPAKSTHRRRSRARLVRHARPCAGHPRPDHAAARKSWMAGSSPAMTIGRNHRQQETLGDVMIYELRTYTVKPGTLGDMIKAASTVSRDIRKDDYGKLEGY